MKKSSKLLLFAAGAAIGAGVVAKFVGNKCCCGCCDELDEDLVDETVETGATTETEAPKTGKRHYVSLSMEKIKEEVETAIDSMKAKMDKTTPVAVPP